MIQRTLLLCLAAMLWIQAAAQPFPVGQISTTITDAARSNRQIPVEIFYPATLAGSNRPVASGEFPAIAIGHGFSMTFDAYQNFWDALCPQGYIVILPKTETGPIPFPSHGEFAGDLSFCLQYLRNGNADTSSPFYSKVSEKAAVMGHSMGGGCSYLAAADDSTITAIVGFAPAETNPSAIAAAAGVDIPALVFAGSKDAVTPATGNSAAIYNALASACKTYITITDGSHCGFAESSTLCEFGESTSCLGCSFIDRAQQHATVFQFLMPWLKFYLQSDTAQFAVFENRLAADSAITYSRDCEALPSSIAEYSAQAFTVSPNPTEGSITLQSEAAVTLFDNQGREVFRAAGSQFDISALPSGIYFLKAQHQNKVSYTRVMKQ